ncbi:MAG: DUF1015 domain-containing protein [Clostridiaceae bacterium]|nr:DUF1015 domain-containing protein [Clostridiaceae bacterium]
MISSALRNILENKLGINISSVLLPNDNIDMQRWAVVACDQYTSEPEYWNDIDKFVQDKPSTLRMIFPEAFLDTEDENEKSLRISKINETMESYIKNGVFKELKDSVILVERTFRNGHTLHGIVFSVDLEKYDYSKGSQSLIRATEGTIIERLPPRIRIRERAPLELPHIMLLIDDKEKSVIEPLVQKSSQLQPAYSFELMKDSGSIKGWVVDQETDIENMANALLKLADADAFKERYNINDQLGVLLFAVGDGNHSLATAKACWENLKKTLPAHELINHPARYALVEVVNLHDSGLVFEPIHRVVFNIDAESLINAYLSYYKEKGCNAYAVFGNERPASDGHVIKFVTSDKTGYLVVECPVYNLDVGTLQNFLDYYLKSNKNASIDYVHGDDVTERLGKQPGNIGFFLSPMDKNELFRTVILEGALPRKTFSMGEASEKRFYLEARRIR